MNCCLIIIFIFFTTIFGKIDDSNNELKQQKSSLNLKNGLEEETYYAAQQNFLKKQKAFISSHQQMMEAQKQLVIAQKKLENIISQMPKNRDDEPNLISTIKDNILIATDPNLTPQCKSCKTLTSSSRLSITTVNLTLSAIYDFECKKSKICQIYTQRILANVFKVARLSIDDETICYLASGACSDNSATNAMLENNEIPCTFCKQGIIIMEKLIKPMIDMIGIFQMTCNQRLLCINYFNNIINSLTGFLSSITKEEDVLEFCKNIINCRQGY